MASKTNPTNPQPIACALIHGAKTLLKAWAWAAKDYPMDLGS